MDAGGDLLDTGARRADHADRSPPDHIGEGQRLAVQDRRAAVRAHHQQAAAHRFLLERDLVLEGHVVGEEHDVTAELEGAHRLAGGELAGQRDQDEVCFRFELHRRSERRRAALFLGRGRSGVEELVDGGFDVRERRALELQGQDQVIGGCRRERRIVIAVLRQELAVVGGTHGDDGVDDPGESFDLARDAHEEDRVVVAVFADDDERGQDADLQSWAAVVYGRSGKRANRATAPAASSRPVRLSRTRHTSDRTAAGSTARSSGAGSRSAAARPGR